MLMIFLYRTQSQFPSFSGATAARYQLHFKHGQLRKVTVSWPCWKWKQPIQSPTRCMWRVVVSSTAIRYVLKTVLISVIYRNIVVLVLWTLAFAGLMLSAHKLFSRKGHSKLSIFPTQCSGVKLQLQTGKTISSPTKTSFNIENVSLVVTEWTCGLIGSLARLN